MTIGAQNPRAIGVVEQHEIAHQLVLIGGDALAKNAERRIAIAPRLIAEHLIVSAVFFDDVNHMLEYAGLANSLGHGARRDAWTRRQLRDCQLIAAIILPDDR